MFLYISFGGCMLSFLLGQYLVVEWLDQCVDICLASVDTTKQLYEVVVPVHTPVQQCMRVFFLHTLMTGWICLSFQS